MKDAVADFKNPDSFFTEIFSIFKHYFLFSKSQEFSTDISQMKAVDQHLENGLYETLDGLRSMIKILAGTNNKNNAEEASSALFFISQNINLLEAMLALKLDIAYVLKQGGEVDI